MAITIKTDELADSFKTESNGQHSITRTIIYEGSAGETVLDVKKSALYPAHKSSLPYDANFMLNTIDVKKCIGNAPLLFRADCVYKTPYYGTGGVSYASSGSSDTAPWDLGIVDWDISFVETNVPYLYGYDENGKWVRLVNSAGFPIVAETPISLSQISFSFNIRSTRAVLFNSQPVINKNAETINGYVIRAYCGKLYPIGVRRLKVYNNDGTIKWDYYQCSVSILCNPVTWWDEFLDVGTLAKFTKGEGETVEEFRGAIYSYTPWVSKSASENIKVLPKYGSMEDVIKAKTDYADIMDPSSKDKARKSPAWESAFAKLPWEEVTELLPLKNGEIYMDAIKHALDAPDAYPYGKIKRIRYAPIAWNSYNFPRE